MVLHVKKKCTLYWNTCLKRDRAIAWRGKSWEIGWESPNVVPRRALFLWCSQRCHYFQKTTGSRKKPRSYNTIGRDAWKTECSDQEIGSSPILLNVPDGFCQGSALFFHITRSCGIVLIARVFISDSYFQGEEKAGTFAFLPLRAPLADSIKRKSQFRRYIHYALKLNKISNNACQKSLVTLKVAYKTFNVWSYQLLESLKERSHEIWKGSDPRLSVLPQKMRWNAELASSEQDCQVLSI